MAERPKNRSHFIPSLTPTAKDIEEMKKTQEAIKKAREAREKTK